jgi:hypothetical protein
VCVGGGGSRIARELFDAGKLDFIRVFFYPLKKWGDHGPRHHCSAGPVFLHAQERIRKLGINCVYALRLIKHDNSPLSYLSLLINVLIMNWGGGGCATPLALTRGGARGCYFS